MEPRSIGDGNGGSLDPSKTTQKEMLVVLHVKMDVVLERLGDHESRIRIVERFQSKVLGASAAAAVMVGACTAIVLNAVG